MRDPVGWYVPRVAKVARRHTDPVGDDGTSTGDGQRPRDVTAARVRVTARRSTLDAPTNDVCGDVLDALFYNIIKVGKHIRVITTSLLKK